MPPRFLQLVSWLIPLTLFSPVASAVIEDPPMDSAEKVTMDRPPMIGTNPLALSYYGIYQGPSMARPLDGGMINTNTGQYDVTSPQNLYNQFKLDYTVSGDVFAGPVVNFVLQPGAPTSSLLMQDSGIRIGHKNILPSGSASLLVDVRLMAPFSPSRAAAGEVFSMNSLQYFMYDVPGTRVSIALCGYGTAMFYGSKTPIRNPANPHDPDDATFYLASYVYYHFNPKIAAVVYLEAYPHHLLGSDWSKVAFYPADISPGISWSITPTVTLTPLIMSYPGNLRWSTIGSVAYLSAKIL